MPSGKRADADLNEFVLRLDSKSFKSKLQLRGSQARRRKAEGSSLNGG